MGLHCVERCVGISKCECGRIRSDAVSSTLLGYDQDVKRLPGNAQIVCFCEVFWSLTIGSFPQIFQFLRR